MSGMRGQLICLLGPNGAGKTTILRTLTGLLKPVNGTVYINGDNILNLKKEDLAKQMAIVLTEQLSLGFLTVFEIASMGRYPHTNHLGKLKAEDIRIIKEALISVGAYGLKNRYYTELSDGEKQKVMIARALVQQPELIVLDEPTSHLDIRHKVEVIKILQKLCREKGITVVLSLHDIDLAIKGCQTVFLVRDGEILAQGCPEEIIKPGTIHKLYGLEDAHYNELLGSMEFTNSNLPSVFVTGGNGTGANVYRALSRVGLGMYCGVLHSNDIDSCIGKSLGCEVIEEEAFCKISLKNLNIAKDKLHRVEYVVDTGFPVGNNNQFNLQLLIEALKMKKTVYSLADKDCFEERFGIYADRVVHCSKISEMVNVLTYNLHKEEENIV